MNFHARVFQLELLIQDIQAGTLLALSSLSAAVCSREQTALAKADLSSLVQVEKYFSCQVQADVFWRGRYGKVIVVAYCASSKA